MKSLHLITLLAAGVVTLVCAVVVMTYETAMIDMIDMRRP